MNDLDAADMLGAFQEGRLEIAERLAQALLRQDRRHLHALHVMAAVAKQQGRFDEAIRRFDELLQVCDDRNILPLALHNRGNTCKVVGRISEAMENFNRALGIQPDFAECWNSLGNVLRDTGDFPGAQKAFETAIRYMPAHANAHNHLGGVLARAGELDEAIRHYEIALQFNPELVVALYNLGNAMQDKERSRDAKNYYRRALAIEPENAESLSALLRLQQSECDWEGLDDLSARMRALVGSDKGANIFPFAFVSLPTSRHEQRVCGQQWADAQYTRVATPLRARAARAEDRNRRIRVGYLSSDLHAHATAFLMAEIFELHDKARFEAFAYSAGPDDRSLMRARLLAAFEHFIDVSEDSLPQLAQRIRDDGIDLLVDLKGYTMNTRSGVLAYRPAPVQINYLGYPGTLGAHADYIIGDPVVTPPRDAGDYSEALALMPWSYQCNDRRRPLPAPVPRRQLGLPEDAVVLCCFNHTYKITAEYFAAWCRLLREHPNTVLWLLQSADRVDRNLKEWAEKMGVDSERIVFAPRRPLEQHLARLQAADLFLDTAPYNAHTTCSDALWMGVPVLTVRGDTFASRVASSLLRAVYLDELVADSLDAYRALASRLIGDAAYRQRLHAHLLASRHSLPLFDAPRFTRDIETLYAKMWSRWCDGLPPAAMQVDTPPEPAQPQVVRFSAAAATTMTLEKRMPRILYVTGGDSRFMAHLLVLLDSFAERMPNEKLLVCDFGLEPAQRAFFRRIGVLAEGDPHLPRDAHPWYMKASLSDYAAPYGFDYLGWVDGDCMLVGHLGNSWERALRRQAGAAVYATANGVIGEFIEQFRDGKGKMGIDPFDRAVARLGIPRDAIYLNSGLFLASKEFLADWKKETFGIEVHTLFEQNAFNLSAWKGAPIIVEAREFNCLGPDLLACEGFERYVHIAGETFVKVVHATSSTANVLTISDTVFNFQGYKLSASFRRINNPLISDLQQTHLVNALTRYFKDLVETGALVPLGQ